jgi:hypothetical protein
MHGPPLLASASGIKDDGHRLGIPVFSTIESNRRLRTYVIGFDYIIVNNGLSTEINHLYTEALFVTCLPFWFPAWLVSYHRTCILDRGLWRGNGLGQAIWLIFHPILYCSVHIGSITHTSPNSPRSLQQLHSGRIIYTSVLPTLIAMSLPKPFMIHEGNTNT